MNARTVPDADADELLYKIFPVLSLLSLFVKPNAFVAEERGRF